MRAPRPSPGRSTAGADDEDVASADLWELEAQVLPFAARLVGRVAELLPRTPSRVADLDAGAGAGALAMASRFPGAHVVAVDRSPVAARRLEGAFRAAGCAARTTAVHAEVDWAWTSPVPFDLVWAGTAPRGVGDPRGLVRAARCALRSGGIFAAVGAGGPTSFLAGGDGGGGGGGAGPEAAPRAAGAEAGGPGGRQRWAEALEGACFTDVTEEDVALDVVVPAALARRFAAAHRAGVVPSPVGSVSEADLAVLRDLLAAHGPDAVSPRTDLVVRATRTLWTARRP